MTSPNSARPRDAASLLITLGRGRESRVLLGRRTPRDRFLPDLYVFPGGRVDPADASCDVTSELRPNVARRLAQHGSGGRSRALAVACIRETHEETGLALGDWNDATLRPALHHLDYVARAITPAGSPIRYHARFFCADAACATGELQSNGELLDLEWFGFDAALSLPMLDVTEYVLCAVARRIGHPAGNDLREHPSDGTAFIRYRNGARMIRFE